jgi:hypothetical protein
MSGNKTTCTPSEADNNVQALRHWDNLSVFVPLEASTAAATVLASKVMREAASIEEIVVHMVDPGDGGANSATIIDVQKNGVTVLSAPVSIADEASANTVVIAVPASDALAKLVPGDLVTIKTGADLGDVFVGLSVEVRIAKRFAAPGD